MTDGPVARRQGSIGVRGNNGSTAVEAIRPAEETWTPRREPGILARIRISRGLRHLRDAATLALAASASASDGRDVGAGQPLVGPAPVRVETLLRSKTTTSGTPITAPAGRLELVASRYSIAGHAELPVHMHPSLRYGYVLAGALEVTNVEKRLSKVFRTGDVIVEDLDTWHMARNPRDEPAELLVLDLAKPGVSNVVARSAAAVR